jgi:hypothetical protein
MSYIGLKICDLVALSVCSYVQFLELDTYQTSKILSPVYRINFLDDSFLYCIPRSCLCSWQYAGETARGICLVSIIKR